jgi:hypothetical protein
VSKLQNVGGGGASIALSQRRDVQVFADLSSEVVVDLAVARNG